MSSPESLAGDHTSSDIARRGQLWGPAASLKPPEGGSRRKHHLLAGEGRETKTRREFSQGPRGPAAKALPRRRPRGWRGAATLRSSWPPGRPGALLADGKSPSPGPKAASARWGGWAAPGGRVTLCDAHTGHAHGSVSHARRDGAGWMDGAGVGAGWYLAVLTGAVYTGGRVPGRFECLQRTEGGILCAGRRSRGQPVGVARRGSRGWDATGLSQPFWTFASSPLAEGRGQEQGQQAEKTLCARPGTPARLPRLGAQEHALPQGGEKAQREPLRLL